jgi:Copper transport outer membrane protein, MctB
MIRLRRHVVAVVAALFALAVGIALGGGPLSYIPEDDTVAADSSPRSGDAEEPSSDDPEAAAELGDAFAEATAARLYDGALDGHPTAILVMPGAEEDLVDAMADQVAAAGGGLSGVFEVGERATDLGETSLVDTLGSQLMTQLDDSRIDPAASTYVRFGQLIGLAMSTPGKGGLHTDDEAETIRRSLAAAELLTAPQDARLAPLVLVVLPPGAAELEDSAVLSGIVTGVSANAAGVVVLGDTASGEDGQLAALREDADVTATVATVDGTDRTLGRVTATLALIGSLEGSVGSYGASGSDGVVPIS